jgi:hypothetical protein
MGTALLFTFLAAVMIPMSAAAASPAQGAVTHDVTGTFTDPVSGSSGPFRGTLNVTNFSVNNGKLMANGTITGTVTYATGTLRGTSQPLTSDFTAPVQDPNGSCTILNLTIGPINVDLLGLVIQTNTIHLTITAQQGPGNLLGNLLCAVTNLLNGTTSGTLQQIADLLNQILAAL